jgi:acyl carrier protein phosphodiesterase
MNFLAHTFLSGNNEDILIGNFMADFVNGSKYDHLPVEIQLGIQLHRGIDQFTDGHPMIKKGVRRLYKVHGKYAPVVIDIIYDHILAVEWDQLSKVSLRAHVNNAYDSFSDKKEYFPERLKARIHRMIDDDFLFNYRSRKGFERSLAFMDRRTKFPSKFTEASVQLYDEWDFFEKEFYSFMPDIMEFTSNFISDQPSK